MMLTIEKATLRREGLPDRFMRSVDRYSRIMGIAVILMAIVFVLIPVIRQSELFRTDIFLFGFGFGIIVEAVVFWVISMCKAGRSE